MWHTSAVRSDGRDEELHRALDEAHLRAGRWLDSLASRPVRAAADAAAVVAALAGATGERLPERGLPAVDVVARLADAVEPGLVASPGPRFHGWVIGGTLPAALAADWLTSAWDQNAGLVATSPAAAAAEHAAARWLLDVLGLPAGASVGFVTGGNQANFACLAAARHAVLARCGWDVERDGLQGAPPVTVVASAERHVTIDIALRYLGLGAGRVRDVATDGQSRMLPADLRRVLDGSVGPTIVCAAAGNINSGAFDDLAGVVELAHARDAWVHVDGAFGLWAAASPSTRHLLQGADGADSWATDGHKTLNVPYDSGFAIVADPAAHVGAMGSSAAYLTQSAADVRDPFDVAPEFSRRARGFATWAALASLGREGVAELVERMCACARRAAAGLDAVPDVEVANEVVFNQVVFRVGDDDERTRAVGAAVCRSGDAFVTPTTWKGRAGMRLSVSGWRTGADDIDLTVAAVGRAVAATRA